MVSGKMLGIIKGLQGQGKRCRDTLSRATNK
jgi:hypothetical protein